MPHLRPTAIAGLLLAAVSSVTLSSCGFDYPTDRVNTIAAGQNNRDHSVDALGIRVYATTQGEGRLIGALANNLDDAASLDEVTSPDGVFTAAKFAPVEVPGGGGVNLTNGDPIELTGDFTAGDFITVQLGFSTGETATLDVPVVKNCFQYTAVPTPSASAQGEGEQEGDAADAAADEESSTAIEPSAEESAAGEEAHGEGHADDTGDATFNCADEAPAPAGEH